MEYIGVCDEFIDTRNDEYCWFLRAPGAPVHEELEEDDEDAGEHGEAEQDEAPAEHGEAVGLPVLLLTLLSLSVLRPRPISVSSHLLVSGVPTTSK